MPGEVTALLSTLCYTACYMLLRKAQTKMRLPDHGLFPILLITGVVLFIGSGIEELADAVPSEPKTDWLYSVSFCILAGVTGTLFGRLMLYSAIDKMGATRGVIVNALAPFITLFVAVTVLDEQLTGLDVAGICIMFAGILFLLLEPVLFPSRFVRRLIQQGMLLGVLAAACQGLGFVFRKVGVTSPFTPLFEATVDGLAALLGYVLFLSIRGQLWAYLKYYGKHLNLHLVVAGLMSAAAVLLFFSASTTTPVSVVSMITGAQPVFVAILSSIFLRDIENPRWTTLISALLVTSGVLAISR